MVGEPGTPAMFELSMLTSSVGAPASPGVIVPPGLLTATSLGAGVATCVPLPTK